MEVGLRCGVCVVRYVLWGILCLYFFGVKGTPRR